MNYKERLAKVWQSDNDQESFFPYGGDSYDFDIENCEKFLRQELLSLISEIRDEMPKEKHDHSFNTFEGTCECGVNRTQAPEDMGFNICRKEITSILNQKEREIK